MTHINDQNFFVLFVVWTLYNMCILYVKLIFVLSLQYFENVIVFSSYCFCAAFVLLLLHLSVCSVSLTYSTYCFCITNLRISGICVCVCVYVRVSVYL
jgi:hypothetical protein